MIQSVQRAAQILAVLGSGTPRLGVTEIATVDRRHFSVLRPRHAPAFDLLPSA